MKVTLMVMCTLSLYNIHTLAYGGGGASKKDIRRQCTHIICLDHTVPIGKDQCSKDYQVLLRKVQQ